MRETPTWRLTRRLRLGVVPVAAASAVVRAAPAPEQVATGSSGLADTLGTRSAWQAVAFQGPPVKDPGGQPGPGGRFRAA